MTTKESIVKEMAAVVMQGAEEIQKQFEMSEEQAIWTALKYACEWIEEYKPEVAAKWVATLSEGKE